MRTIREERRGKLTLRVVEDKTGYAGVVLGDGKGRVAHLTGNDPADLWRRLDEEAGKASKGYIGFDGARARFLQFFPLGFEDSAFKHEERDYKLKAKARLDAAIPLEQVAKATGLGGGALTAFRDTNLLSPFEMMRVQDLLRDPSADRFVRAAGRFALGEGASALAEMTSLAKPHDCAKWTTVTYLPFLWRPDRHMFLKPEVTKDFAGRVGHRFIHHYTPALGMPVYESLLDLVAQTALELKDLHPKDRIDVQSFFWTVGAYTDADMPQ
jgi:hypothetical protein